MRNDLLVILDGHQLVSVDYISKRLGCAPVTTCRLIASGEIPPHVANIGKTRWWYKSVIDNLELEVCGRGKHERVKKSADNIVDKVAA